MQKDVSVPIEVNVTKMVVFISAFLFTIGIYLIISSTMEWIYFSRIYDDLPFTEVISFRILMFMIISLLFVFVFPSNDFRNFSKLYISRDRGLKTKLLNFFSKLETSILIYLVIYGIYFLTQNSLIYFILLIFTLLSLLVQTPFSSSQKKINKISNSKLKLMDKVDKYLSTSSKFAQLNAGFYQQIFPMFENYLAVIIAIMMPTIWWGIFSLFITQTFIMIFYFWDPFSLSKRGNYFRTYVNILMSVILIYFAYLILL